MHRRLGWKYHKEITALGLHFCFRKRPKLKNVLMQSILEVWGRTGSSAGDMVSPQCDFHVLQGKTEPYPSGMFPTNAAGKNLPGISYSPRLLPHRPTKQCRRRPTQQHLAAAECCLIFGSTVPAISRALWSSIHPSAFSLAPVNASPKLLNSCPSFLHLPLLPPPR